SNFSVYLDKQMQQVTSNNTVDNVTPGSYTLKVTHEGYTNWVQDIVVREGLVTDVAAQLFPQELQLEQLTKTNIRSIVFTDDHREAFYVVTDSPLGANIGLWQQNLVKSNIPLIEEGPIKISNLTGEIQQAITTGDFQIIPSPSRSKLLLMAGQSIYVLDAGRYNEPDVTNLLSISYTVETVEWLSDNNLIIGSENLLIDYDVASTQQTLISFYNDHTPIYTKQKNSLVFVDNGKLYRYQDKHTTEVELDNITLPSGITALFSGTDNDSNLVMATATDLFFLYIPESYLQDLGQMSLLDVSPTGRNLLVSDSQNNIKSVQINVSLVRNVVEYQNRATTLPATIALSSINWEPNSGYFAFRDTGYATKIFSADRTGNNVAEILDSSGVITDQPFNTSPDGSGLFLLLRDNDQTDSRLNLYLLKFGE
ncbi:carboxypeptidase regulatory-like domain-containing protein, partial [Candidatus Dojkabacteria bacterium]|nr:carboxypeptidase regulatory-like domain-containing protein [Candidatus Dojkabacteria bacterium]